MKTLTVEEFLDKMDEIMDDYGKGSDEHYKIVWNDDGVEKAVCCTPYDGPYTETVKEKDGEMYVELPERLLAKMGWKEGTEINMEVIDGAIHLTEKK